MKQLLLFVLMLICGTGFAQVNEGLRVMPKGKNNAMSIALKKTTKKDVEKKWEKYISDYKGKTKLDKKSGIIFSDNAEIEGMSDNTIDVYAQVVASGADTELVVWYNLGGAYLSSSEHPEGYGKANAMLVEFAGQVSTAAVEELLAEEEDKLKKLQKEKEDLEKEKKGLESDIKKYEEKIAEAKKSISENESAQGSKKDEVATQQKVIDEIKTRLKKI